MGVVAADNGSRYHTLEKCSDDPIPLLFATRKTVGILSAVWIVSTSSINHKKSRKKKELFQFTLQGCIHDSSTSAKFYEIYIIKYEHPKNMI